MCSVREVSFIDFILKHVTYDSDLPSDTKEDESALPALSMRGVDLMPVPFLASALLHDKISLRGTSPHAC